MPPNIRGNRLVLPRKDNEYRDNWDYLERWANTQVVNQVVGTGVTSIPLALGKGAQGTGIVNVSGVVGIGNIISDDKSVTITNPTGPTTHLSVQHLFPITIVDSTGGGGPSNVAAVPGNSFYVLPTGIIDGGFTTHILNVGVGVTVVSGITVTMPTYSSGSFIGFSMGLDITNTSGSQRLGLINPTINTSSGASALIDWTSATTAYSTGTDLSVSHNVITSAAGGQYQYRWTAHVTTSALEQ